MPVDLIPLSEAARRLGYGEDLLRDLVQSRRIPHRRLGTRGKIMFAEDDLAEFIASLAVPVAPAPQARAAAPGWPR